MQGIKKHNQGTWLAQHGIRQEGPNLREYVHGLDRPALKEKKIMATPEKVVNYSPDAIAAIKAAAPLNLEKAKAVAADIGKTYRSVIAKAKSLGLEYISKPAPAKKAKAETKAEIVGEIGVLLGDVTLDGLAKAPAAVLNTLRFRITAMTETDSES